MKKKILIYTMAMIKGGTERTVTNLANHFIEEYDVTIVTNINGPIEYDLNKKIKAVAIDEINKKDEFFLSKIYTKLSRKRTSKLKEIVEKEKPNLIISFLPEPTLRILSLKKHFKDILIIISVRNHPNKEFKGILKLIRNYYYKKADKIIIQDEDFKKYFSSQLQKRMKAIPNYLSDEFLEKGKRKEGKTIISIARLEKQKNHKLLIRSFAKLDKKYNDYNLVIYGEGSQKKQLMRIIKKYQLDERVFIEKPISNIKDKLDRAALFVLSSNYEGMPNALLEAMARGVPVISTNSSPAIETIIIDGKNGLIIKKRNQKELTESMEYLLANKKIRDNISKEAVKVKDIYKKNRIIKEWEETIK